MRKPVVLTTLVLSAALLAASLAWLLSTPSSSGTDEDWRWRQPLAGSALPAAPTAADLHRPFLLGAGPFSFSVPLPAGTYGYAIAEAAPIRGGHVVIQNESGGTIAEADWGASTGLGYFAAGLLQGFSGGLATFTLQGTGRALLLRLDLTLDLGDGTAGIAVPGRLASSVPLALTQAAQGHGSRVHLKWSGVGSLHGIALDQDFHQVAESTGTTGDLELRLGASAGAYYVLEGSGDVQLEVVSQTSQGTNPLIPGLLVVVSVVGISIAGRAWKSTNGGRAKREPPEASRAESRSR